MPSRRMHYRRLITARALICAGALSTWTAAAWAFAPEGAPSRALGKDAAPVTAPVTDVGPGLGTDELPPRLQPVQPRTGADEARLDALGWFGAGRLLQQRGDLPGALRAYRKALERDPTAGLVYRVAIPLAIELRQLDEAARWAAKAVELLPDDYLLLMQTAALMIGRDDLGGAIHVLEQAAKARGLDKQSPKYVLLMRDLALLYTDADRKSEALAGYEVVFDALLHPEKYHLDARTRDKLLGSDTTSFEKLGQVFLDEKQTELALRAFEKAAESRKGPAAAALSYNLAQVYLQAGQPEKALHEIEKYIDGQRQTKERAAYQLLADILKALDRPADLIPRLETSAAQDARNPFLQYFLADQYAAAGRLAEAEALYKKTLDFSAEPAGYLGLAGVYRRQAKPADLLDALARAYAEAGDLKGMQTEFKAITADEQLLKTLLETGDKLLAQSPPKLDFASGYVLANLAADGKQTAAAEKLYRHLLAVRKDKAKDLYEELAGHYHEVHRYADAVKVYQQAIDDPLLADARPNLMFSMTQSLALAGDTKRALETIAAAQELIPNHPLLRYQEAWVYYHSHQFDEAITRFERLLTDFPQSRFRDIMRRVQFSLSNVYVLKGDIRKGEEILEGIYRENPNDISVNNDLGYLYADQGKNLEQAEQMIRKALGSEPENAAYLDSMGWVLFKLGKYAEALPYLEKAVKISTGTGDETLWEHVGDVHERLMQPAQAVAAWKKSLALAREAAFPDEKLIERVQEKLKNLTQEDGRLKPARPGAP